MAWVLVFTLLLMCIRVDFWVCRCMLVACYFGSLNTWGGWAAFLTLIVLLKCLLFYVLLVCLCV